jgi:hypothetical protein
MMIKPETDTIDTIFHYSLLGLFLFSSVSFFFLFVINWETWFFGTRLEGFSAGILLFIKFLIPTILAFLLVKYPDKITIITMAALAVFGIIFLDSSVTIQKNTAGKDFAGIIPVVSVLVPALILAGSFLAGRIRKRDGGFNPHARGPDPYLPTAALPAPYRYRNGDALMFALAGVIVAFLVGPVVLSLLFSPINAGFSPAGDSVDSLLTKIDLNGTMEWQTRVRGYSDSPLIVSRSVDGGFIIGGMFRPSALTDADLNVMKLSTGGDPDWNFQRGTFAYRETNLGTLQDVLPTAEEYTVIMADGFVIRLDAAGNELWHHRYPNAVVQSSISLPGGGYLMTGEVHKGNPSEPGWYSFEGWMLATDRQGNILWEKSEKDFVNCRRAYQSPNGDILVSCSVADQDPEKAGSYIIALDSQGNYLWNSTFVEKNDGIVYSILPSGNMTTEVNLRGEGEKKFLLDPQGNVINEVLLPMKPDSNSHQFVPDISYSTEPHAGNRTRISVAGPSGQGIVFMIEFFENGEGLSRIYSVKPTSDGGYLVASSA